MLLNELSHAFLIRAPGDWYYYVTDKELKLIVV